MTTTTMAIANLQFKFKPNKKPSLPILNQPLPVFVFPTATHFDKLCLYDYSPDHIQILILSRLNKFWAVYRSLLYTYTQRHTYSHSSASDPWEPPPNTNTSL